jgi:hypothetical protein
MKTVLQPGMSLGLLWAARLQATFLCDHKRFKRSIGLQANLPWGPITLQTGLSLKPTKTTLLYILTSPDGDGGVAGVTLDDYMISVLFGCVTPLATAVDGGCYQNTRVQSLRTR